LQKLASALRAAAEAQRAAIAALRAALPGRMPKPDIFAGLELPSPPPRPAELAVEPERFAAVLAYVLAAQDIARSGQAGRPLLPHQKDRLALMRYRLEKWPGMAEALEQVRTRWPEHWAAAEGAAGVMGLFVKMEQVQREAAAARAAAERARQERLAKLEKMRQRARQEEKLTAAHMEYWWWRNHPRIQPDDRSGSFALTAARQEEDAFARKLGGLKEPELYRLEAAYAAELEKCRHWLLNLYMDEWRRRHPPHQSRAVQQALREQARTVAAAYERELAALSGAEVWRQRVVAEAPLWPLRHDVLGQRQVDWWERNHPGPYWTRSTQVEKEGERFKQAAARDIAEMMPSALRLEIETWTATQRLRTEARPRPSGPSPSPF
jgi:hypothetical protein